MVDSARISGLLGAASAGSIDKAALVQLLNEIIEENPVNPGVANTGTTVQEFGNAYSHVTVMTVNTTLPAIAGGANLAVGKLLYTLPAGRILVNSCAMNLAITQTQGNITADTPDVGMGTTIGSGVVAVLGGTAAFENLVNGVAAADCNGTATVTGGTPTAAVPLLIAASGGLNRTIYFNAADGWAASGDAAALLTGSVVLQWDLIG